MSRLFALLSNRQAAIKERGMRHIQAFPQDYEELVSLAFGDTQPQSWYAAYILGGILEQDPQK